MLEPGEYALDVLKAEAGASKVKGSPQLAVQFRVVAGASTEVYNGHEFWQYYSLVPGGAKRIKCLLNATGVVPNERGGFNDEQLVGAQIIAEVYLEPYNKGTNPSTGEEQIVQKMRLRRERPSSEGFTGATAPAEEAPAPAPAAPPAAPARFPAAKATPAVPAAHAPLPARPAAGPQFPKPGMRAPIPGKK
jgi:hypothetical protein